MERRYSYLWILVISALAAIVLCEASNNTVDAAKDNSVTSFDQAKVAPNKDLMSEASKKKSYLQRFAQSWKYYAKANDIAKREKLRKALLDALKSMNTKKKSTVTSLTHDTVERIQHAAKMLKEFKRMYKLSSDVMSSWKDYDTARKSLLDIGKTKAGNDILKKYVVLRDKVSDKIKRSQIAKPTIVDDQDIQESIEKDKIARHGEALKSGDLIVQRAMTPGTLQIIRPKEDTEAAKRMELLSDAKEAARQAYTKAKQAIAALKEKLKTGTTKDKKTETNDQGTNKKSVLAEGENEVREEGLGHVNSAMAISSMIKKAEKEDLAKIADSISLFEPKSSHDTELKKNETDERKIENNNHQATLNKTTENAGQNASKATPTTSISSLMDSLGGADDSQPTKAQSRPENTTADIQTKINPLYLGETKEASNASSSKTGNEAQAAEKVTTSNANNQTQTPETKTNAQISPVGGQTSTIMLMKSVATEHREMTVKNLAQPEQPNVPRVDTSSNNSSEPMNSSSATVHGTKKFHLSEVKIREEVAKTIDRQLETLKRLQDAKKARRKYESAKRELQNKIKNLYDMAVSFEKPIKDAQEARATIDKTPGKDEHPGAALAGISEKPVAKVNTPSNDGDHHGFTLGVMDSQSQAHIVDMHEQAAEKPVEKVYEVGLQGGGETPAATRKSGVKDEALKSLTEAIKNDLKQIEENQKRQQQEERQSTDLKKVIGPLISKFTNIKDSLSSKSEDDKEKVTARPEAAVQALGDKKNDAPSSTKEDTSAKAEDAFKEVEDYLSKALKHVAKEAINEEGDSGQTPEFKETSGIVNEEDKAKIKSQTAKSEEKGTKEEKPKEETKLEVSKVEEKDVQKSEKDKEEKEEEKTEKPVEKTTEKPKEEEKEKPNEMDRNERLRKIVEDAMKEHAKDPSNPHPVNADLFKPTEKLKKDETTSKVTQEIKTPEKKVDAQKIATALPTKSSLLPSSTDNGVINRSNNDAIGKAEHLEEQVASLQDKLYSQGRESDAYKSIDNVEQKPLFSQEQQEQQQEANPGEQPMYQEPMQHHSHRRHHKNYDYEEDDNRGREDDYDDDDDNDDDEEDAHGRSEYDDDEEEEEEDRRRKKSYLQNMAWPPSYRNYQRDQIINGNEAKKQQETPMMNAGMMNDEERDELEDTKKSEVPKGNSVSVASAGRGKMYIL